MLELAAQTSAHVRTSVPRPRAARGAVAFLAMSNAGLLVTEFSHVSDVLQRTINSRDRGSAHESGVDLEGTQQVMVSTLTLKLNALQHVDQDQHISLLRAIADSPFTDQQKRLITATLARRMLGWARHSHGRRSPKATFEAANFAKPHRILHADGLGRLQEHIPLARFQDIVLRKTHVCSGRAVPPRAVFQTVGFNHHERLGC